jgi:DNA polymerase
MDKTQSLDVLQWHQDMGIDGLVEESPQDHTVSNVAEPPIAAEKKEAVPTKRVTMNKVVAASDPTVREQIKNITTLEELKKTVESYQGLGITKTATNTVFSDGNPEADVMFVGEAPGADEDAQGIPFCGASGQLLDKILSFAGFERQKNFYITNTIFWRPPGNRKPTPEELATCEPFVQKHVALIKPKLIILVGGTAVTALLDMKQGITKVRGQFLEYNNPYLDSPIPTTAIFHPSYLLRSPGQKKLVWLDLLMIRQYMKENNIQLSQ